MIAITGASGVEIGVKLIEHLVATEGFQISISISKNGHIVCNSELGSNYMELIQKQGVLCYQYDDFNCPYASGSALNEGMVISPCSMGTLGRIANGISSNLIERAADVCIKEKRKLVLVIRELPLSNIHLENMLKLSLSGVVIESQRAAKGEMMVLTLCSRCERDFRDSGYVLVKKGWQETKEDCDFCKVKQGLNFGVFGSP